jgi:hypothetical protein
MNEVRITDLNVAAFLISLDYELVRVEGPSGRRVFLFANVPPDVITSFYNGRRPVDARKLLGAVRDLKGLVVQNF